MSEELMPEEENEIRELVGNAFKPLEALAITEKDKVRVRSLKQRTIQDIRNIRIVLKNSQLKQTNSRPLLK